MSLPLPNTRFSRNSESGIRGAYCYGFNGYEELAKVYYSKLRGLSAPLATWLSLDPLNQFDFSPYAAFANSPISLSDPSGGWIPEVTTETVKDENGNDKKIGYLSVSLEEGDDAKSLSAFLGISENEATDLYNGMLAESSRKIRVPDHIAKPINEAIQHSIDYPSWYDSFLYDNYNCFVSAVCISKGWMPSNELNDQLDSGIEFCRKMINTDFDPDEYENVSETPEEIKFGRTIIRFGGTMNGSNYTPHAATYLGTSKDGTIYTWSKDGWSNKPGIRTATSLCKEYDAIIQGAGPKVNEGGYYNFVPQ